MYIPSYALLYRWLQRLLKAYFAGCVYKRLHTRLTDFASVNFYEGLTLRAYVTGYSDRSIFACISAYEDPISYEVRISLLILHSVECPIFVPV
jgi:hypothetical protein